MEFNSDLNNQLESSRVHEQGGTICDVILHCYPAPSYQSTNQRACLTCQSSILSHSSTNRSACLTCQSTLSTCQSNDTSYSHLHSVAAHRYVLAANSSYFRALFHSVFADSSSHHFLVPCCSVEVLSKAVAFMHTGDITIPDDLVAKDLLQLADFLGASRLVDACMEYYRTRISVEKCFSIKELAVTYGLKSLDRDVTRFMVPLWPVLIRRREVIEMGQETLRQMISAGSEMNYAREVDVLAAVCRWAELRDAIECSHASAENLMKSSLSLPPLTDLSGASSCCCLDKTFHHVYLCNKCRSKENQTNKSIAQCSQSPSELVSIEEEQFNYSGKGNDLSECSSRTEPYGTLDDDNGGNDATDYSHNCSHNRNLMELCGTFDDDDLESDEQQCCHHKTPTSPCVTQQCCHVMREAHLRAYDLLNCVVFDYLDDLTMEREVLGDRRVREWLEARQPLKLRDIERRLERSKHRDRCDVLLVRSRVASRHHNSGWIKRAKEAKDCVKHRVDTTCRETVDTDDRMIAEILSNRTVHGRLACVLDTCTTKSEDLGSILRDSDEGLESKKSSFSDTVRNRREYEGAHIQLMIYDIARDEWRLMAEPVADGSVQGGTMEGLESMVRLRDHVYMLCSHVEDVCGSLHARRQSKRLVRRNVAHHSLGAESRAKNLNEEAESITRNVTKEAESLIRNINKEETGTAEVELSCWKACPDLWEELPSPQRVQGQTHLVATTTELLVVDRHGTVERFNPTVDHDWCTVVTRGLSYQAVATMTVCVLPLATDRALYLLRTHSSGHSFSYSQKCFQLYRLDTHSSGATWQTISEPIEAAELFTHPLDGNPEELDLHGISLSPGVVTLSDALGRPRAQVLLSTSEWKSLPVEFPQPSYFKLDRSVWGGVGINGRIYCVREGVRGIEMWMYDVFNRRYKLVKQPPLCPTAVMCALNLSDQQLRALTKPNHSE